MCPLKSLFCGPKTSLCGCKGVILWIVGQGLQMKLSCLKIKFCLFKDVAYEIFAISFCGYKDIILRNERCDLWGLESR